MRRVLCAALALAALWLAAPAQAQMMGVQSGISGSAGPCGGYQGVGDIQSGATAYYGVFAYSAATCGNSAFDLERTSDSTFCTGVKTGATTGVLDTTVGTPCPGSTTVSSWCNATTCKISKAYDQTGVTGNVVQATVASQPTLTLNCIGSVPCLTFAGGQQLSLTGVTMPSPPYSFVVVANRTSAFTSFGVVYSVNTGLSPFMSFYSSANTFDWAAKNSGDLTASATDSTWHSIIGTATSTSQSDIYIDGTHTGGGAGGQAGNTGQELDIGCRQGAACLNGTFLEAVQYAAVVSAPASMSSNQHSRGGF